MGNVIMKAQQITYGASNVEKALDDLKAPELIELNKRMDAIDAWKANVHEVTFTGSELTIENALALPARSLITEIEAIQDLHGYDHPWAGGAEKNKLNYSSASINISKTATSYNTVIGTFTCTSDVDITASWVQDKTLSDSTRNTIELRNRTTGTITYASNVGDKALAQGYHESTFASVPAGDYDVIMWAQGISDDYTLTQPMVRLSSVSDTSWEPYANICPISGRTAAVITRSDGDEISEDFTIQLGTTVYGADINWDTGVMTVNKGFETLEGASGENWQTSGLSSNTYYIGLSNSVGYDESLLCNMGKRSASIADVGDCLVNQYNNFIIKTTYDTVSAFKVALANNPLQICYTLATTTTIQLTPTQLELLKGYNRVTLADGYGEIELKALVLGGDN